MKEIKNPERWIEKFKPCQEAVDWWRESCKKKNVPKILNQLKNEKKFPWANWLLMRILSRRQAIQYAIYAANTVLPIYEKKYPNGIGIKKSE